MEDRQLMALSETVARCFKLRGQTLAAAESCTGGLLSAALTGIPGSSEFFLGGVVAYDNSVKIRALEVSPLTLERFGAVSPATAEEMARGVCRVCSASYGISITGIAGPGGGTPEKPVGLVYIGLFSPGGSFNRRHLFIGDRYGVRWQAAAAALEWLASAVEEC